MAGEGLARTRAKRGGNRSVMTKLSNETETLLKDETVDKQRLKVIAASLLEKLNLVKKYGEEIIDSSEVELVEAEIEESDEIISRVMDLLRVLDNTTSSKDDNAAAIIDESTPPCSKQTTSPSEPSAGTSSGSPPSTIPSGSSENSTLASGNAQVQFVAGSSSHGGIQASSTPHVGNMQPPGSSGVGFQSPSNFSLNVNATAFQPKAKLPKLVLPKFRGDVTQWQISRTALTAPYTQIHI